MRAIVTVIGKDRVGIIATVCNVLSKHNVNVLDISQTVLQEYFTMIMLVDASGADLPFADLTDILKTEGETFGVDIRAQREDILQTARPEAQIESLVIAKGYTDCVAYMTNEGISVAVSAPEGGLQPEDVAVIADIVMSQSDYLLTDIRIVEVS